MGRKSSAKSRHGQPPPIDADPPRRGGFFTPLLAVAIVVLVGGGAWYAMSRAESDGRTTAAASPTPAPTAEQADMNAPAVNAKFGPHKQAQYPPLDWGPMPPARPPEVTRAAYTFAAEHPEILGYVPCYCGCEKGGHRGNDDCFVAGRAPNGDVTSWEPHGAT